MVLSRVECEALDVYEAALREADPAAELERLRARGFRRGTISTWTDGAGGRAVVTEYELASPEQAQLYLLDGRHGVEAQGVHVEHIDGGFACTATDNDGFVGHVVSTTRGQRHVLVVADAGSGLGPRDAIRLARAQLRTKDRGPARPDS